MKLLITGGCGYIGSRLVPYLLSKGYDVRVLDSLIFGNHLQDFNFELIKGDIRNIDALNMAMSGVDAIIHLAAISNDPTAELNPEVTKEVNYDAVVEIVKIAKESGVKRIILASSSTLYGFQGDDKILNESDEIHPLTLYGKYKAESEKAAFEFADDNFTVTAVRPGTVAGFSLRQRFDLIVNIFANHAFNSNSVTIEGGSQKRPIVNIQDMCRAYETLLVAPKEKINKESFNIVGENKTIKEIAEEIVKIIPGTDIKYVDKADDRRSYFTDNTKIKNVLGFKTKYNLEDATIELVNKFNENFFNDSMNDEIFFNMKRMKKF